MPARERQGHGPDTPPPWERGLQLGGPSQQHRRHVPLAPRHPGSPPRRCPEEQPPVTGPTRLLSAWSVARTAEELMLHFMRLGVSTCRLGCSTGQLGSDRGRRAPGSRAANCGC